MPDVACVSCKSIFYAKPSWIKNGYGKFCSRECYYTHQKNGKTFTCSICSKHVYRSIKYQHKSKSGKFFCSKSCQAVWRNSVYIGENHANWKHGRNVYRDILKRAGLPLICSKCKTDDTRILAVHHKDKNRRNNTVENLLWLCHNCHFLVHHHPAEAVGFLAKQVS